MSERPTVTLCMIVKDEEHIITTCLESVYKHIDRYDITDTGSSDKTKEIIKTFFEEKGIPGEVHEEIKSSNLAAGGDTLVSFTNTLSVKVKLTRASSQ